MEEVGVLYITRASGLERMRMCGSLCPLYERVAEDGTPRYKLLFRRSLIFPFYVICCAAPNSSLDAVRYRGFAIIVREIAHAVRRHMSRRRHRKIGNADSGTGKAAMRAACKEMIIL